MKNIEIELLTTFAETAFFELGLSKIQAQTAAKVLVDCDATGLPNQGLWRLPMLCRRIKKGGINKDCQLKYSNLSASVFKLDGDAGVGHYIAHEAMNYAIEHAKRSGCSVGIVHNSQFIGAAGYYAEMAAAENMVGMILSNSFPKVAAPGGKDAVLGTNPLAFAAPRSNGKHIVVDMATSAIAGSTLSKALELAQEIPPNSAIDSDGNVTTDAREAAGGVLLPMAGGKGFGLALLVEILSGVLSGAAISHGIGSAINQPGKKSDNGHFVLVLDISRFLSINEFQERIEGLCSSILSTGCPEVRLPGDNRSVRRANSVRHGITLDQKTRDKLERLSEELGIATPW